MGIILILAIAHFFIFPFLFLDRAKEALLKGRYTLAEKDYSRVLSARPNNLEAHRGLILLYLNTDKFEEASIHLDKVKELDQKDFKIFYTVADKLFEKGSYMGAIENYKTAIDRKGDKFSGYLGIGRSYREISDYKNAVKWLNKATELKLSKKQEETVKNEIALTFLAEGKEYMKEGEKEKAKKSFKEVEKYSLKTEVIKEAEEYIYTIEEEALIPEETPVYYNEPYVPPYEPPVYSSPPPEEPAPTSNVEELMW